MLRRWAALATMLHQAATREEIRDGAGGGPVADPWMLRVQHDQQLARPPEGMRLARRDQQLGHQRRERVRACVGRPTAITEAAASLLGVARDPFVPGFPADAVAGTQLRHGEAITEGVLHELKAFIHGVGIHPRHRDLAQKSVAVQCRRSVNHVAGLLCKPCTRAIPAAT